MGQKINPNLLQVTKTNEWTSKYFEKIPMEFSVHLKKDQEVKNFITRFFKMAKLSLHHCRLYYFNKSLYIFISYHLNLNGFFHRTKVPEINKIRFKQFFKTNIVKMVKKKITWKYFKLKECSPESYTICKNIKTNFLLKKLFDSLASFIKKKIKLFLVLKELNFNTKRIISCKKNKKKIKKNIISLRKYKDSVFFKEGINILFSCATNKKSARLLSQFIVTQLRNLNLKHYNLFIRFVQNTLKLFKNSCFSKFKGIKIEIKGRLSRGLRAKSKTIRICNSVSVLTINSIIDYSEETAFTSNGTLGIKIWIHEF